MDLVTHYDGQQPRRSSFQWTPDQAPSLPPNVIQKTQSKPGISVDSSQLPQYILVTPSGEAQPQQLVQSSFQDEDAWAGTNWLPPQPAAPLAAPVLEPGAKPFDHFLGKSRPSTPSELQTSLMRWIATAKTVCLTFLVLCVLALCVLIFSMVGELPAIPASSVGEGTIGQLRIPTGVFKEKPVTSDLPTSVQNAELKSEESLAVALGRGDSMGDAQQRFLGTCAVCRFATRHAIGDASLEGHRHVSTPGSGRGGVMRNAETATAKLQTRARQSSSSTSEESRN